MSELFLYIDLTVIIYLLFMFDISIFFKRKLYYPIIILLIVLFIDIFYNLNFNFINIILKLVFGILGSFLGSIISLKYLNKKILIDTENKFFYIYLLQILISIIPPIIIIIYYYYVFDPIFIAFIDNFLLLFSTLLYIKNNFLLSLLNWFEFNILLALFIFLLLILLFNNKKVIKTILYINIIYSIIILSFEILVLIYYMNYPNCYISSNFYYISILSNYFFIYSLLQIFCSIILFITSLKKLTS